MTLASVIQYYQKEFPFDEADIDEDAVASLPAQDEEDEQVGCMAALCACFREDKRRGDSGTGVDGKMAKRLVAISKRNLLGGD
jgi:hypothetical protein